MFVQRFHKVLDAFQSSYYLCIHFIVVKFHMINNISTCDLEISRLVTTVDILTTIHKANCSIVFLYLLSKNVIV